MNNKKVFTGKCNKHIKPKTNKFNDKPKEVFKTYIKNDILFN